MNSLINTFADRIAVDFFVLAHAMITAQDIQQSMQ